LARNDEEKQILDFVFSSLDMSEPFLVPAGTPKDTVAMLRKAFSETMADPELVAQAAKQQLDIDSTDGESVQKIVDSIFDVSPVIKDKAKKLLGM
jgi:tripartite-type tricarboxylate transporter receptor subunit TctC